MTQLINLAQCKGIYNNIIVHQQNIPLKLQMDGETYKNTKFLFVTFCVVVMLKCFFIWGCGYQDGWREVLRMAVVDMCEK